MDKAILMEAISIQGDGIVNEDTYGYANSHFWVLDGATSKTDKKYYSDTSDARLLVTEFSTALEECCYDNPAYSNHALLKAAISRVEKHMPIDRVPDHERAFVPSFTMTLVYFRETDIVIDLLSDCYVVVQYDDHIDVYTDKRVDVIKNLTQGVRDMVCEKRYDAELAEICITERKRKNRDFMNVQGGYWAGTIDGKAFDHTESLQLDYSGVLRILLCSDGFFRAVEFGLYHLKELFNSKTHLSEVVHNLRLYEASHKGIGRKNSDDATAMMISVT